MRADRAQAAHRGHQQNRLVCASAGKRSISDMTA